MALTLASDWSGGWADVRRSAAIMRIVARRELLTELRQRNKFVLDVSGHVLGLLPVLITAWAATGGGVADGGPAHPLLGETSWLTFVVLGYVAFAAYGVASPVISFTGMAFALQDEQTTGTLERSLLAPAPRIAVVLGTGLYYTALYLFHVASLLVVSTLFLGLDVAWSPGTAARAALALALIFLMSIGFGILSSAVLLAWKDPSLMMILVHRPMLLLSGAYFLIPTVPEPFQTLAWFNPIAYAVDAFRGSLSGVTILLPLDVELGILTATSVGITASGLWLFDRLMTRWQRSGSLGTH
jgi:ABC-type multidrug transport system permease subunit